MPVTIRTTRLAADTTQRANLEKLFSSQGFLTFKEMVVSRCAEAQVKAMNALTYPDNSQAALDLKDNTDLAVKLNGFLDLLDDFEKRVDEWFTTQVELSR